jgi:monoamine oxidase
MMPERVIVIGAGAAGLAAGRTLHDDGNAVIVLEARDRVGGRAHTSYDIADHPVELGAEFVHGQNVCTWELLERFGLDAIDIHDQLRLRVFADGKLWDESFLQQPNALLPWKLPFAAKAWMDAGGADLTLADAASRLPAFLDGDLTDEKRAFWNTSVALGQCGEIDEVGVGGIAEATHDGDGDKILFRLRAGYSTLMACLADGLDVRESTPVERVEWSGAGVVVSAGGERFEADRVVVTLPLAILQAGDLEFAPSLPRAKRAAIDGLRHGPAAKIVLRFRRAVGPEDMTIMLTTTDTQVWWRSGAGRTHEDGVLTSLICGRAVERLRSSADPAAEGLRLLEEALGCPLAGDLVESRFVDWGADPWSKMGYSYVPPGGVGLRDALAAPVADVLFFAGEATNTVRPQSVHGAFDSGVRAAREIAALRTDSAEGTSADSERARQDTW